MTAIVPLPRPDEIVHGLLGRFTHINRCSRKSLPILLQSLGNGEDLPKPLGVHALARARRLDVSEFVRAHTLLPFVCAFAPAHSEPTGSFDYSSTALCKNAARRNAPVRFCRSCIADDIHSGGFSYWHRCHQLPGIEWCRKHDEPLMYVEDAGAFDKRPQDCVASASVCEGEPKQPLQRSILRAYTDIAEALLERDKPTPVDVISSLLRSRAVAAGLRPTKLEGSGAVGPFALARCPMEWWQRHFTASPSEASVPRTFIRLMQRKKVPANGAHFYALALAMFYDTAASALSTLDAWKIPDEDRPQGKKYPRVISTDAKTIETYIECAGSTRRVADALGIHEKSASRGLSTIGLPSISAFVDSKLGDALEEFFNGESVGDACKRHGVSPKRIENLIRSASCLLEGAFRVIRKQKHATSHTDGRAAISA